MSNPFLTHEQQLLVAVQTTPGTFEPGLGAAHGKTRLYFGAAGEYRSQKNPVERARASLTRYKGLGGTKGVAFSIRTEANTPDDITAATEVAALFQAGGHVLTQAKRIGIGAITSGPVLRNATGTGGTSGATVRVWRKHVTLTDTFLYYVPVSGTLQSGETVTFTGGASCVTNSAPTSWGWSIRPGNPGVVVSAELQENGYAWSGRDCMAGFQMESVNADKAMWTFPLVGVKEVFGTKAMTTGIAYDTEDPPILYNGGMLLNAFAPEFSKWNFDMGVNPILRQSGNAPGNTGLRGGWIGTRDPKIKVTYEHVPTADFDVYGLFDSEGTVAFSTVIGQVVGKQVWTFADEAVISEPPALSEQDGMRIAEITLSCVSLTDNKDYEVVLA